MGIKPIIEELGYFPEAVSVYGGLKDEPYSSFLDSGMDEAKLGRFSFIGYDPFMVIRCKGERISVSTKEGAEEIRCNPFRFLKETLSRYRTERAGTDLPFTSGCVGYFSYDLRYFIERLPDIAADDIKMPDFLLSFYDAVVIFDNLHKKAYVSSSGLPCPEGKENRRRAGARLKEVKRRIENSRVSTVDSASDTSRFDQVSDAISSSELTSNFSKQDYFKAIGKAKDHIARGDIYQVNLSQRFECRFDGDAFSLFARLRKINPAPFAAYLNLGDLKVVSASPERFLKIDRRHIETRPIKGTRPRGSNSREDLMLKEELLSSAKDRAEHIMIVDLERNDLGRVCEYGSVAPTEFIIPEAYSTVHHLVSTVSGTLREGVGIVDCLENCFPGGSITGAPKIRSMEIIEELEPAKRGIYTGSVGYIDTSGDADLSIVIRTIIITGGRLYFQVGGGIVADSDPEKEYQETLDKGRALAAAVNPQRVPAYGRQER